MQCWSHLWVCRIFSVSLCSDKAGMEHFPAWERGCAAPSTLGAASRETSAADARGLCFSPCSQPQLMVMEILKSLVLTSKQSQLLITAASEQHCTRMAPYRGRQQGSVLLAAALIKGRVLQSCQRG